MDKIKLGKYGMFHVKETHKICVKDAAFAATKGYSPSSTDEDVWGTIDRVFDGCYSDMEPFGRRPHNRSQEFRQAYRERYFYGYVDN